MATLEKKMMYIKSLSGKTYKLMEEMHQILCKDDDIDVIEMHEILTSFIGTLYANYLENLKESKLNDLAIECARILLEDLSTRYLDIKNDLAIECARILLEDLSTRYLDIKGA